MKKKRGEAVQSVDNPYSRRALHGAGIVVVDNNICLRCHGSGERILWRELVREDGREGDQLFFF